MCLILFAYRHHSRYPLVVAANRDERFDRPTRQAQFWPEAPHLLAGKDLEAGGTWMGITRAGRFAAVTNFRGHTRISGRLSRGQLCTDFLQSDTSSHDYAEAILQQAEHYAGFNLLIFDGEHLVYCNNQHSERWELEAGIYGLSNGLLDAPWPKIDKGKQGLRQILTNGQIQSKQLLALLHDDAIASDHLLPQTGVGIQRERLLSPLFIRAQDHGYGTCNSTALLIENNKNIIFHERSYYHEPVQTVPSDQRFQFSLHTNSDT